mgnify:CR=1 FL=1
MARAVTFGEIMMRLAPPSHERFLQATSFDVTYAGGEANVAVSLAAFGHDAEFVTALPHGPLGDAAAGTLRYYGVGTSSILRTDVGRLGLYFPESGAAQRGSQVIYDRAGSAVAVVDASSYDWGTILGEADAFHTTGITPALGEAPRRAASEALATARQLGMLTSFDLNYRGKLWSPTEAREAVEPMLENVDLIVGNEEDAKNVLGIAAEKTQVEAGELNRTAYEDVARQIAERYGAKYVAITLRESESATVNHWSACLLADDQFRLSRRYTMHVVDRVGAGDAFCGGLLSALLDRQPPDEALEFAVAASCLKHSIHGDFNKVTKDEVLRLVFGHGSGRVDR